MVYSIHSITPICTELHQAHKTLVLATGFFDLLHAEHLNFLRQARAVGDVLIVAVESDERARLIKGEGRPVEPQSLRCAKLSSYADYVIALGQDFNNFAAYDSLMAAIKPHVYAVSEHTSHQASKSILAEKYGGKLVIVHAFNPDISTTKILETKNNI